MAEEPKLRAVDLLRQGALEAPVPSWTRTTGRIWCRRDRRPVGNSARFWKRLDEQDPFLPPRKKRHDRPEHKPVYAAGRFIRLDQAKVKKRIITPQDRLIERLREEAKRTRERALANATIEAASPASEPAAPPAPTRARHMTSPAERAEALRKRLAEIEAARKAKAKAKAAGKAIPEPPTAQPAPVPTPKATPTRHSGSGRFRASAAKHQRRGWAVAERSPFEEAIEEQTAAEAAPQPAAETPPEPTSKKRRRQTVRSASDIPDLPPIEPIGKIPTLPSGPPGGPPPAPKPPPRKAPAPPPSGGGGSLSMDDLFGAAAMEGRVRIGRTKKKKPEDEAPADAAKPKPED